MRTALFLITLGFGYTIFSQANKKSDRITQILGKVVAIFMMVVSFGGILYCLWFTGMRCVTPYCPLNHYSKQDGMHHQMGMGQGKKMFCPVAGEISQDTDHPSGSLASDKKP